MGIKFKFPSFGTSEVKIAGLEESLKVSLPSDFTEFLLQSNGGKRPAPNTIDYVGVDGFMGRTLIAEILGVDAAAGSDIYGTYQFYLTGGRIPTYAIPFAKDFAGNLFCIRTDNEHFGEVCFWDHEFELTRRPEWNLAKISGSFHEFVSLLKAETDAA